MDDIAGELSISKKTIYQYFSDKDELVSEVTRHIINNEIKIFKQFSMDAKDPLDELVTISKCLRENFKDINPSLLYDLKKYHKRAWGQWLAYKSNFVKKNIADNLRKGIEKGFYRKEIDIETLATFRMQMIEMAFDVSVFPKETFSLAEVQMQIFDNFVYGLLTDKGRKLYQEYQDKLKTNY